jgi:hypothetical protein
MKLPSFKRLFENDFDSSERNLVAKLALSLNQGIENLYLALSKRISLRDNIQCTVKDVQVTVDSNGIPINTTSFRVDDTQINQNIPVIGCMVINATNSTNPTTYPTATPFISWTQTANAVQINHVSGLQANNTYVLRIVAFN